MLTELKQRHCFLKYIIEGLKSQFIINIRAIIMKPVLKNHGYTTRPVTSSERRGLSELTLERQVAGRLRHVSLAIGSGSYVGRGVDRTDGVTGANQKVC